MSRGNSSGIKIFIGNLAYDVTADELVELFSQYGTVNKCDRLKNFAFLFMADQKEANAAVQGLSNYPLRDMRLTVQLSTKDTQGRGFIGKSNKESTKIFVGNLAAKVESAQLIAMFEQFGTVVQGDALTGQGYGFIHMQNEEDAAAAIDALNGAMLEDRPLTVQMATNTSKKGKGGGHENKWSFDRRDYTSRGGRHNPYPSVPPNRRLPPPSSALSDLTRDLRAYTTSLQLQAASLLPASLQLLAPPSLGLSALGGALRRYEDHPLSLGGLVAPPAVTVQAAPAQSSGSGESLARELLKFYLKNPSGFDAYARDPLVHRALDLDEGRPGSSGGMPNQPGSSFALPAPSAASQQLNKFQEQYRGSFVGERY